MLVLLRHPPRPGEPIAPRSDRILHAVDVFGDPARIQVCPDCGLRTRSWDVGYEKLKRMVEGTRLAFGVPCREILSLASARRIVSFDRDFLEAEPGSLVHAREFAAARRPMATADDISAAAMFLCSPLARNISGQVLPVNAGEPAG